MCNTLIPVYYKKCDSLKSVRLMLALNMIVKEYYLNWPVEFLSCEYSDQWGVDTHTIDKVAILPISNIAIYLHILQHIVFLQLYYPHTYTPVELGGNWWLAVFSSWRFGALLGQGVGHKTALYKQSHWLWTWVCQWQSMNILNFSHWFKVHLVLCLCNYNSHHCIWVQRVHVIITILSESVNTQTTTPYVHVRSKETYKVTECSHFNSSASDFSCWMD